MKTLSETLTASDARTNLYKMIDEVNTDLKKFTITKSGKPKAVIMDHEEFLEWLETLEITSDEKLLRGIREGRKEIKRGETVSLETVIKEYEQDKARAAKKHRQKSKKTSTK